MQSTVDVSVRNVAALVGIGKTTAHHHLTRMVNDGKLRKFGRLFVHA